MLGLTILFVLYTFFNLVILIYFTCIYFFFQIVIFLPALCRKMGVPYCIVKGKQRLGRVVHRKTATCLAITTVNSYVFVYNMASFYLHLLTWLCFNFNYWQITLLKRGPGWTNGYVLFTTYHKCNATEFESSVRFYRHLP